MSLIKFDPTISDKMRGSIIKNCGKPKLIMMSAYYLLLKAGTALLLAKSKSKEVGFAPRVAIIDAFITSEFERARETVKSMNKDKPKLLDEANILFRQIVKERL